MKLGVISPYESLSPLLTKVSDTLFNLIIGSNYWESPNKVIGFGSKQFKNCVEQFSKMIIFCKYENGDDVIITNNSQSRGSPRGSPRLDLTPRGSHSPKGSPRLDSPYGSPYGSPRGSPR